MASTETSTQVGTDTNTIENDRITSNGGSDGGSDIKKELSSEKRSDGSSDIKKELGSEKRYDVDIESQDDNVGKVGGQTNGVLDGDDIERGPPRHITLREIWEKRSFSLFYQKFNVYFHIAYFIAMTVFVLPLFLSILSRCLSRTATLTLHEDGGFLDLSLRSGKRAG